MRKTLSLLCGAAALAAVSLSSSPAQAGIEACGDINLTAEAECEVKFEGGCEAECTPVNFKAACAASGTVECSGMCSASADIECTTSCQGSCEAECEANPPAFDCRASCNAPATKSSHTGLATISPQHNSTKS